MKKFDFSVLLVMLLAILSIALSCEKSSVVIDEAEIGTVQHSANQDTLICEMLSLAIQLYDSISFNDFLGDSLVFLLEKDTISSADWDLINTYAQSAIQSMFSESNEFEDAFLAVYNAINAEELDLMDITSSSCSFLETRACWICNTRACATATVLSNAPSSPGLGTSLIALLGDLGTAVHCD